MQPANRGISAAIAYSLLRIARFDADSIVSFFPTDHYYSNKTAFLAAVARARETVSQYPEFLVVLDATSAGADSEYGWIQPGSRVGSAGEAPLFHVNRYWEKPSRSIADELYRDGGLLNTFVMIARARTLMDIIGFALPGLSRAFILLTGKHFREAKITQRIYRDLPAGDFSHQVPAACADRLRVLPLVDAGWSDLGTEERVNAAALRAPVAKAAGSSAEPRTLVAFQTWLAAYRKRLDEAREPPSPAAGAAGSGAQ